MKRASVFDLLMPFSLLRTRSLSTGAVLLIASGVVLAYLAMLSVEGPQRATPKHRWWSDDYDRNVYHRIAQFYPTGQTPYRESSPSIRRWRRSPSRRRT